MHNHRYNEIKGVVFLKYFYLILWIVLFFITFGITVKRFIKNDKNKYWSLFGTVIALINLIIEIVFLILK